MAKRNWFACCALVAVVAGLCPVTMSAKVEEWRDLQGNTFKGEPEEVAGPVGVFRVSARAARLVPFRLLSPEDCVRFYEGTKAKRARAADWKDAATALSQDLFLHTQKVSGGKLVDADLHGRPEPDFYVILYATNREARSWQSIDAVLPLYPKLKQAYPGAAEVVFYGLNHEASEHTNMAVSKAMPWLVADFREQSRIDVLRRFAPIDSMGLLVLTRTGLPLYGSEVDGSAFATPMTQLIGLLEAIHPSNPKSWKDRAYYLRAVQPVAYANGRCDPVLVGNPLRADGLRQRHVRLVEADIEIDAEGAITSVTLNADEQNVPAPMAAPLREALERAALFVPAVDHGKFVPGTYHYRLEVGP